jgi:hypothetical protein
MPTFDILLASALIFLAIVFAFSRFESQPPRVRNELRGDPRYPANGAFKILLRDAHGNTRMVMATCIDISHSGARAQSAEPIAPASRLLIDLPKYNLTGPASVRHCTRQDSVYHIGIKFSGRLTCLNPGRRDFSMISLRPR